MKTYVSRGLWFTLCVGGLWLAGTAAADAAESSSSDSAAPAVVGVTVPLTVAGNGISILGDSMSSGASVIPASVPTESKPVVTVSPDALAGVIRGNRVLVDIVVPVTVAGNAVSVVGDATQSDSAVVTGGPAATPMPVSDGAAADDAVAEVGAGGTGALLNVDAPVVVDGNAISVLGDSSTSGGNAGASAGTGSSGGLMDMGLLDVGLPVVVGGNAISVLGDSVTTGASTGLPTEPATPGESGTPDGPAAPEDPGTVATPGTGSAPGVSARSAGAARTVTASLVRDDVVLMGGTLASTGSDELGLGALAALLGLVGVLALFTAANRRHHHRVR